MIVEQRTLKTPDKATKHSILTINGGSSSIKFALFESIVESSGDSLHPVLEGEIKRIGQPDATFKVSGSEEDKNFSRPVTAPEHHAAVDTLIDWLMNWLKEGKGNEKKGNEAKGKELIAVGHRVVQGGPKYSKPQRITPEMIEDLHKLSPFDPEHLPEEILLIEAFQRRLPDIQQVACFDTDFHHDLPRVAQIVAIPRRYEAKGIRRYGFHGISYTFLMNELEHLAGKEVAHGRVVLAHLGNGASLAAVQQGKPLDTSMGFTPTSGIPMSCRSGDLDPGLLGYLSESEGMDIKGFNTMIHSQSGLLGISETSSDMHDLLALEDQDARAAEAVSLFCYQVKKWIGSYAAVLGGIDTLVFSGGIGENAPIIRSRICEGMGFLGIELNASRNAQKGNSPPTLTLPRKGGGHFEPPLIDEKGIISTDNSRVSVRVIPTNEEKMIAQLVCKVLQS